jgi:DNA-binding response OmpR family regulator
MKQRPRILLVEDEQNFGEVLRNYLELSKFSVDLCENGNIGLSRFKTNQYDLCILDVMMPEKDGFTLAREIKEINKDVPLIFLTAKGLKEDQMIGFKLGADDYITKPFDTELLIFKIHAILKRSQKVVAEENLIWDIGHFKFEPSTRELRVNGSRKRLTPKEADLFVMPRQKALVEIWKNDDYFATRSMDVYIAKLRKYLKEDNTIIIENIHGSGYRLICPEI